MQTKGTGKKSDKEEANERVNSTMADEKGRSREVNARGASSHRYEKPGHDDCMSHPFAPPSPPSAHPKGSLHDLVLASTRTRQRTHVKVGRVHTGRTC